MAILIAGGRRFQIEPEQAKSLFERIRGLHGLERTADALRAAGPTGEATVPDEELGALGVWVAEEVRGRSPASFSVTEEWLRDLDRHLQQRPTQ